MVHFLETEKYGRVEPSQRIIEVMITQFEKCQGIMFAKYYGHLGSRRIRKSFQENMVSE